VQQQVVACLAAQVGARPAASAPSSSPSSSPRTRRVAPLWLPPGSQSGWHLVAHQWRVASAAGHAGAHLGEAQGREAPAALLHAEEEKRAIRPGAREHRPIRGQGERGDGALHANGGARGEA